MLPPISSRGERGRCRGPRPQLALNKQQRLPGTFPPTSRPGQVEAPSPHAADVIPALPKTQKWSTGSQGHLKGSSQATSPLWRHEGVRSVRNRANRPSPPRFRLAITAEATATSTAVDPSRNRRRSGPSTPGAGPWPRELSGRIFLPWPRMHVVPLSLGQEQVPAGQAWRDLWGPLTGPSTTRAWFHRQNVSRKQPGGGALFCL